MSMRLNSILKATALGSLLALAVTGSAHAVDGVIEINQARAKAGGVTPGDTPGFPVTISLPGSYRLTSNLDVRGEPTPKNVSAILITATNVTVDLNGFSILGPTTCTTTPSPVSCPSKGSGDGIGGGSERATILNGTVAGMGNNGISVGPHSRVEKVTASNNPGFGIAVSERSSVTGCIATANGDAGVAAILGASIISGNLCDHNVTDGIRSSGDSAVLGNAASFNKVGLNLDSHDGYGNNVMNSNATDVSAGFQIEKNVLHLYVLSLAGPVTLSFPGGLTSWRARACRAFPPAPLASRTNRRGCQHGDTRQSASFVDSVSRSAGM